MTEPGNHLARIVSAWSALFQRRSTDELAALLDESVVWQGLLPELMCHSREEVLHLIEHVARRVPHITRMEAEEFGDAVAVSVEGVDFPENEVLAANTPRSLVFTFSGGSVVRMQSFASRDDAFAAARKAR